MTKENKLNKLEEILKEYVKYLKVYKQVVISTEVKNKVLKATYSNIVNNYGITEQVSKLEEIGIEPTEYVKVKYFDVKLDYLNENGFESIEFPAEDLDKRIEHYRNKLKYIKEKNTQTIA